MKNYSLYVNYRGETILVCEDETSVVAECFKDALLIMHQDMMRYAYTADMDVYEKQEFLVYADLLVAIYHDDIPYDHETDDDCADPDDSLYIIDATEYIDKYYHI